MNRKLTLGILVLMIVTLSSQATAENFAFDVTDMSIDEFSWNKNEFIGKNTVYYEQTEWNDEFGSNEGFGWIDEFEDDESVWEFDNPLDYVFGTVKVTICNDAPVRQYAMTDAKIVNKIPSGKQIEVMGLYPADDGTIWAETVYCNDETLETGYISIKDIKESQKLPKLTDKVVVTANEVAIYDDASGNSKQVGTAHKGDVFDVWCYQFDSNSKPWASCFIASKSQYVGCIPWTALKAY